MLLNPLTIEKIKRAIEILEKLEQDNPEAITFNFNNCTITKNALKKGIAYYKEALTIYNAEVLIDDRKSSWCRDYNEWFDCGGYIIPKQIIANDISYSEIETVLSELEKRHYYLYQSEDCNDNSTTMVESYINTLKTIKKRLSIEASTEFFGVSQISYGIDFEEDKTEDFSRVVGRFDDNLFIRNLLGDIDRKIERAEKFISICNRE